MSEATPMQKLYSREEIMQLLCGVMRRAGNDLADTRRGKSMDEAAYERGTIGYLEAIVSAAKTYMDHYKEVD